MIAQHIAQRLVQQVRGGVVGADGLAARMVQFQLGGLATGDGPLQDFRHMQEHAGHLAGIGHPGKPGIGADIALIAHLTAAFRIERRLVHHEIDGLALRVIGRADQRTILDDGQNLPFGSFAVIAQKLGRAVLFGQLEPDLRVFRFA